ncbi:MAG TPA: hypothetical protein VJH92_03650, partial [Candidatus Nanoarchaeia archaeon]|nr:hypothetical protein [Candidatus Nanoarchaeia archaeon]
MTTQLQTLRYGCQNITGYYDYDGEEMQDRLYNRVIAVVEGVVLRFKLRLGLIGPNKLGRNLE